MQDSASFHEDFETAVKMIRSGRSSEAIPILNRLIESDAANCLALRERGFAKRFCNDHAGSIADFTAIIGIRPNQAKAYFDRAEAYRWTGDLHAAIEDCSTAILLGPQQTFALLMRGGIKASLGDLKGAIADFTDHILHDGREPLSVLLGRGRARHGLGDFTGAIEDLTEAMRLELARPIFASLCRGRVKFDAGDYRGAIADFTLAIEGFPSLTNAYRHRAEAKMLVGDRDGAEDDLSTYDRLGGQDLPAYE